MVAILPDPTTRHADQRRHDGELGRAVPKKPAPRRGRGSLRPQSERDEELEDEQMERNPRDHPFPTFAPTVRQPLPRIADPGDAGVPAALARARVPFFGRGGGCVVPLVPLVHPSAVLPQWDSRIHIPRTYIAALETDRGAKLSPEERSFSARFVAPLRERLLSPPRRHAGGGGASPHAPDAPAGVAPDGRLATAICETSMDGDYAAEAAYSATAHAPWITSIRRVACGCPQLGMPISYEGSQKQEALTARLGRLAAGRGFPNAPADGSPQALSARRPAPPPAGSASASASASARRGQRQRLADESFEAPPDAAFVGRPRTKDEAARDLLRNPRVAAQLKKDLMERAPGDAITSNGPGVPRSQSFLVALPKIGVRLFALAEATATRTKA